MPEARKSRPIEDNRRTAEEDTERLAAKRHATPSSQAKRDAHAAVLAR